MRVALIIAAVIGIALAAGLWVASGPRPFGGNALAGLQGDATQGEAVFLAAGFGSCHISPDRDADPRVLSGGRKFATQFGTFRAPNISSDPDNGIGN